MKRFISFIISFTCSITIVICQSPSIQWQKCLGGSSYDHSSSISQTVDRGYIIAGATLSNDGDVSGNHGDWDYWIVKLDSTGDIRWQKCIGGSYEDQAFSINQTKDSGFIIAGHTQSDDGDVSDFHGDYDYWIVKLDLSGNIEWQKCLGGTSEDKSTSIKQTLDGGYIVAGYTNSNDGDVSGYIGRTDYWIVKLDSSGNIEWQKCLGGYENDRAVSINLTLDGGYIVAGTTNSTDGQVSGKHGGIYDTDYWIVKLDSVGDLQWQKCLGGSSTEEAQSIQQTLEGGYIVVGYTYSNDGDVSGHHNERDYWIVKLNSIGSIQWQKCLGGTGIDIAGSINQTLDEGYLICGYTNSNDGDVSNNHGSRDYWIIKLDSIGNVQWKKCLGGSYQDYCYSGQQTLDGGYIVAGITNSNDGDVSGNNGDMDIWIVKITEPLGIKNPMVFSKLAFIYPNPFLNKTIIEFNNYNRSKYVLTIMDITGSKVKEIGNITTDKIEILRGTLNSGIYMIELRGEKVFRAKLVVD